MFRTDSYPEFDTAKGGSIQGVIEALTIMRDGVRDMIEKGMTLEQVKAAEPALEYDGIYGTCKEWSGDVFLTAVYNDLNGKKNEQNGITIMRIKSILLASSFLISFGGLMYGQRQGRGGGRAVQGLRR